ncbi:MAG: response regulator [Oscillospiraceae bacterium]|nr:response regulator [Oscillospiraceae bacterium]
MSIKGKYKKLLSLLVVLILIFVPDDACCMAAGDEEKILKVAFYQLDGFFEYDISHNPTGYGVELLGKISEYTGIKFEYVDTPSWEQTKDMLLDGKADIRMPGNMPAVASDTLDYSSQSIMDTFHSLMTLSQRSDLYYEDMDTIRTLKIAVSENLYIKQSISDFINENGIPYKNLLIYDNYEQVRKALENGEADAIISNVMDMTDDMKILMSFNSVSNYISMLKGNPDLNTINEGICRLRIDDPEFIPKLYKKWYPDRAAVPFTKEETQYIEDHPTITVGNLHNRYPFSSLDYETGELSGINEDILDLISGYSGLNFNSIAFELKEQPVSALKAGKCDIAAGILETAQFHSDRDIIVSDPFCTSSISIVKPKNYIYLPDEPQTVAVKTAFQGIADYIGTKYPQYEILKFDTDEECLDALVNSQADILLQNVYVTNYLLQKPKYETLEILPTSFFTEKNCFAVRSSDPDSQLLISILNKSIKKITEDETDAVILKNTTARPYKFTLEDTYYRYRYAIMIISSLLIILLFVLISNNIMRRRHVKKMEAKNIQLAEVYRQTQVALRSKSDFLARMSHEIRTPMNAIIGITELAYDHTDSPEKICDDLDKIALSSRLLLSVINDVLDMSSIEAGKMKIACTLFDFKQLITSITTIFYAQCRNKKVDFEVKIISPIDEHLMGDPLRLNQILINLLSNSVKFTDEGNIVLTIEQKALKDNKVYIRFMVSDSGCGMSEDMLKRIFHPFEQENSQTAMEHGGSGLGLSIVRNLVTLMDGAVNVESKKGTGTTFTVDLPFGVSDTDKAAVPGFEKLRILVIDDEHNARNYASAVLQRIGVRFTCSDSASEALSIMNEAAAADDPYNVCLVDWKMPQINGIEITRQIRAHYDKNKVVIIAAAYDYSEIDENTKNNSADLFITKPLFQSTLFDILMSLSGGRLVKKSDKNSKFDFGGKKVLLAEDNQMNRIVATGLLEKGNIVCDTAENGLEAVNMFESSPPGTYSAILMDIQMPVMNGYDAVKKIRSSSHPQSKSVPVIAMTANALAEDVSNSLSCGMNAHVSKPIEINNLFETLERIWSEEGDSYGRTYN